MRAARIDGICGANFECMRLLGKFKEKPLRLRYALNCIAVHRPSLRRGRTRGTPSAGRLQTTDSTHFNPAPRRQVTRIPRFSTAH
jgi:hypothetical protein